MRFALASEEALNVCVVVKLRKYSAELLPKAALGAQKVLQRNAKMSQDNKDLVRLAGEYAEQNVDLYELLGVDALTPKEDILRDVPDRNGAKLPHHPTTRQPTADEILIQRLRGLLPTNVAASPTTALSRAWIMLLGEGHYLGVSVLSPESERRTALPFYTDPASSTAEPFSEVNHERCPIAGAVSETGFEEQVLARLPSKRAPHPRGKY
ncbi:hypothetical protein E4U52_005033 [Claviceps spartinae]|nr:hypothetical protein E4U52_005033 [Claviceps spartinae]